jgi:hypothetical protein
VNTAGCALQGDVRTKVKTPGTGKILVEEAVQTSTWRGCANSIISQSRVHTWSPTLIESRALCMPGRYSNIKLYPLSSHIMWCIGRVSLCSPGWSQTHDPPAYVSQVLGLQA